MWDTCFRWLWARSLPPPSLDQRRIRPPRNQCRLQKSAIIFCSQLLRPPFPPTLVPLRAKARPPTARSTLHMTTLTFPSSHLTWGGRWVAEAPKVVHDHEMNRSACLGLGSSYSATVMDFYNLLYFLPFITVADRAWAWIERCMPSSKYPEQLRQQFLKSVKDVVQHALVFVRKFEKRKIRRKLDGLFPICWNTLKPWILSDTREKSG